MYENEKEFVEKLEQLCSLKWVYQYLTVIRTSGSNNLTVAILVITQL